MCLVAFSVTAKAEQLETPFYTVYVQANVRDYNDNRKAVGNILCDPFNEALERYEGIDYVEITDKLKFVTAYTVTASNNGILVPEGNNSTVILMNIDDKLKLDRPSNDNEITLRHQATASAYFSVTYTDGSKSTEARATISKKSNGSLVLECEFVPEKDVSTVYFVVQSQWKLADIGSYVDYINSGIHKVLCYTTGGEIDLSGIGLEIHQQTEEAGLLSGLLEWVKSIWENITDMGENLKNGFSNVVNGIIELPSKIWTFISDGLQDLFIPNAERLASMKDNMSEMLESKLGAIYQVGTIVTDLWDGIEMADQTNTIEIPETQIPLPEGASFSFGGYQVKIVPDGFDFLATAVKLLSGILCTVLFVNGMRKRYDDIMGVKE